MIKETHFLWQKKQVDAETGKSFSSLSKPTAYKLDIFTCDETSIILQ